jgi:hypothetical protein
VAALRADIDQGTLPAFGMIIPNVVHDAHGLNRRHHTVEEHAALLADANEWLMANVTPLLPKLPDDTIFILTFDEDETSNPTNNRIFTAITGQHVRHGVSSDVYDHEDLLATIAALLQVTPPPFDETGVRPIGGVWQ